MKIRSDLSGPDRFEKNLGCLVLTTAAYFRIFVMLLDTILIWTFFKLI